MSFVREQGEKGRKSAVYERYMSPYLTMGGPFQRRYRAKIASCKGLRSVPDGFSATANAFYAQYAIKALLRLGEGSPSPAIHPRPHAAEHLIIEGLVQRLENRFQCPPLFLRLFKEGVLNASDVRLG